MSALRNVCSKLTPRARFLLHPSIHPSVRPLPVEFLLNPLQHDSGSCQIGWLQGLVRRQQSQVVGICRRLNCLVTGSPRAPWPGQTQHPQPVDPRGRCRGSGWRVKAGPDPPSPGRARALHAGGRSAMLPDD